MTKATQAAAFMFSIVVGVVALVGCLILSAIVTAIWAIYTAVKWLVT